MIVFDCVGVKVCGLKLLPPEGGTVFTYPVSIFVFNCGLLVSGLLRFQGNHIFRVCL